MPIKSVKSEHIALPGADVRLAQGWLGDADARALFNQLETQIHWEIHEIRLFGRTVASPRLSSWIGDPEAAYRYSGTRFPPRPWPAALEPIRGRLCVELGIRFNSVLANRYRDGNDAMGWHRDDEPELGSRPVIASLSLGGARRFVLKGVRDPGIKRELVLGNGSLLVMAGETQRYYRHALPRTRRHVASRINLTFRVVETPSSG